jgi:hypothetical protein
MRSLPRSLQLGLLLAGAILAVLAGFAFSGFLRLVNAPIIPLWSAAVCGVSIAASLVFALRHTWQRQVGYRQARVIEVLFHFLVVFLMLEGFDAYFQHAGRNVFWHIFIAVIVALPPFRSIRKERRSIQGF